MSIDDDYFDLRDFLESFENDRDRKCMLEALDRIINLNNRVTEENKELHRQLAALKAAIVVLNPADIKITEIGGEAGRYINLELSFASDEKQREIETKIADVVMQRFKQERTEIAKEMLDVYLSTPINTKIK